MSREMRELVKCAEQQGWSNETRNGHLKLRAPNGFVVVAPKTPSDPRSRLNTIALMRRQGFIWKGR